MNIKDEIKSKDRQIQELKEEDKRLTQIIIEQKQELRKRKSIIEMQNQIIDSYEELRRIITSEVK